MLKIGNYNTLKVSRVVDFGAYLDAGDGLEILMPAKFFTSEPLPGDEVDAFVYTDSQDRLIATTEKPYAEVGDFAFLQVADTNSMGTFLDWGLEAKQLLVPFSEQRERMHEGGIYLVYVYLDHTTNRVVASSKIEKYVGNVLPSYKHGQKVEALLVKRTEIGYKCIVDNLHWGMIYANEVYQPLALEQKITAYVKRVREDGKIDLSVTDRARARTSDLSEAIMEKLNLSPEGFLPLTDKSDPQAIKAVLQCSKRDFKKAVGKLYKDRLVAIGEDGIFKL
ncbi:MAG: S1-like domain-containing RNA-binding protein [Clostridium sp.]|nr:S1-like domain-containing RNA-binding protein [Clostridium sp.]